MPQTTLSNQTDIAVVVNEAIKEGKKLTEYLLHDAAHLDAAEGLSIPNTRQLNPDSSITFRRQWTHYIETGHADVALSVIAPALASLRVGSDGGEHEAYLVGRSVDVGTLPMGQCIPTVLIQDKAYYTIIPKSVQGRYEIIYNIRDGVIIFGHIKRSIGEALKDLGVISPGAKRFMDPCDVIGAMFQRLHINSIPKGSDTKSAMAYAKQLVTKSVSEKSPLQTLPPDTAGAWLPGAVSSGSGISESMINNRMRTFLNYVVVFVNESYQASAIIKHRVHISTSQTWKERKNYMIGQRNFYALLGSDVGQDVAWLLAKRKNEGGHGLGWKVVRQISVFHGSSSPALTHEEVERYCTPVLVFEVVDGCEALHIVKQFFEDAQAGSS